MASETQLDPFNWPMPGRKDLMGLSTINQVDIGTQKYVARDPRNCCLQTQDIKGASTLVYGYQYHNKESFINKNDDISGTKSKILIKNLNKPFYSLKNDDIKGTKTQINQFQTVRKPFNPLTPEYQLPQCTQIEPEQPKFLRDNIDVADIEGSKPSKVIKNLRKEDIYTEIEGSKPRQKFMPKNSNIDILNVKDINQVNTYISKRNTNPMLPEYEWVDWEGGDENAKKKIIYGQIEGTKSKQLHPREAKSQNFINETKDIEGTAADSHSNHFLRRNDRTQFREINKIDDINGARPESLKKGIQTKRSLNPLQPIYVNPGDKESLDPNYKLGDVKPKTTSHLQMMSRAQSHQQIQKDIPLPPKRDSIASNKESVAESQKQNSEKRSEKNFGEPLRPASSQSNQRIGSSHSQRQIPLPRPETVYCSHHKKSELNSRSGMTSSHTNQAMTVAQKMDNFLKFN